MITRSFILLVVLVTVTLVNNTVFSGNPVNPDPSCENGHTASVPSLPDLTLEDDFICGDVNKDGLVNVLDIISMVNYIMGGSPSPFNTDAADITADGGINVLDIIALVNIILQVPGIPCPCIGFVSYEGQTYQTVQIGEQCWFKENLNVGTMVISNSGGDLQIDNDILEKFCYNNDPVNCTTFGGLYDWDETMQYVTTEGAQGICPADWHIPTDNEWKTLEGTVDAVYPVGDPEWDIHGWRGFDAGSNLRETGTAHWYPPNNDATNSSGFTGLPGGMRNYDDGGFDYLTIRGHFYSSTQMSEYDARSRYLNSGQAESGRFADIEHGFSVRCIKGCIILPTQANAGPDQSDVPGTSAILAGNAPTSGTGLWAIISGTGGTVVTPSNPTSEFQGLAGNEYELTWTITTICDSSADTVLISFAQVTGQPCPGLPTVLYEGQTYNTVQIGNQCWLRENLNVGTMILMNGGGQLQTDNGTIEKYCQQNDEANCDVYGGLYEWREAMQYVTDESAQGICPDTWHVASDPEYAVLRDFLGGKYAAGGKMKSTGTLQ
ncbi:MAG TPA: FISUMP domain-containing protein, partial [Bacteroidales bacterium]|nr:FISUMP domain-containing protein [Bacteroidales bacterium]